MPCTRGGGCHRRRLHMVCSHLGSSVRGAQAAARSTIATVVAAAPPSSQEGEPPTIEPMTDYERFMFDLKGFVVIPSVLGPEELAAVRGHIDAYSDRPQSLPDSLRSPVSGPAEFLIDHPRVLGILTALVSPDTARLRLESMFTSRRSVADGTGTGRPLWRPHGGGPGLRGPSFDYRTQVIQRTPGSTTLRGGCVCNREMLGVDAAAQTVLTSPTDETAWREEVVGGCLALSATMDREWITVCAQYQHPPGHCRRCVDLTKWGL